jgi:beta-glucanase (GH16 family)
MRWLLDQQVYQVQTNWPSSVGPFPAPFDQRFHLILNVAVGGNWPGSPDEKTTFPQAMVVDYVRVYGK